MDRVTRDDYLNKYAIDLNLEFNSGNYDNETGAVQIWLNNNEEDLLDFLNVLGMNEDNKLWNEKEFVRALLEQDKHLMRYGEVPLQGMKDENGNFVPFVAPKAKRILRKARMLKTSFSRYGNYYG